MAATVIRWLYDEATRDTKEGYDTYPWYLRQVAALIREVHGL